jgi:hypothetical protein
MVVDKTLEIDLNNLTPEALDAIDNQLENLISRLQNPETRNANTRNLNRILTGNPQRQELLEKLFGRETVGHLINFGKNPLNFIQGNIVRIIPFIGAALATTGIIAMFIKRVDDFQKEFIDNVDGRIELFRSKQQQAEIQAGLTQLIITSSTGSAEPRDAFNSFEQFNTDQSRIESEFKVRETGGVA